MINSIRLTQKQLTAFIDACRQKDGAPYDLYLPWAEDGLSRSEAKNGIRFKRLQHRPHSHAAGDCHLYSARDMLCMLSDGLLCGICTVFSYTEEQRSIYELYCLVHPDFRRRGIGSTLLEQAVRLVYAGRAHSVSPSVIYLAGSDAAFAARLNSSYSHSEYFMKRPAAADASCPLCPEAFFVGGIFPDSFPDGARNCLFADTPLDAASLTEASLPEASPLFFGISIGKETVCRCRADILSGCINISHVYTEECHRGKGLAPALMCHVASLFPDKDLLLQVSGSNTAAVRAYEKAGFTLAHAADYYLFAGI